MPHFKSFYRYGEFYFKLLGRYSLKDAESIFNCIHFTAPCLPSVVSERVLIATFCKGPVVRRVDNFMKYNQAKFSNKGFSYVFLIFSSVCLVTYCARMVAFSF